MLFGLEPYGSFRDTSPDEFAAEYVQEHTFRTLEGSYYGREFIMMSLYFVWPCPFLHASAVSFV